MIRLFSYFFCKSLKENVQLDLKASKRKHLLGAIYKNINKNKDNYIQFLDLINNINGQAL